MSISPTDCDLARESVSLQLDGELPEQDFDRLETHLRFCPECSAWADQVRDVTLCLRDARVERPADAFVLPRHSRRWRVSSAVALGSAAAVVATMFAAPGHHSGLGSGHHVPLVSRSASRAVQPFPASSRVVTLDGRFIPISTPTRTFRPV